MRAARLILLMAVLCGAVGGCGDSGSSPSASTAPTPSSTVPTPPGPPVEERVGEAPQAKGPGTGEVVLGATVRASLVVDACSFDATVPEGAAPVVQVEVSASGVDDAGREVQVTVRRFASRAAAVTVTDTVTVAVGDPDDPTLVLRAQRFEVDGLVSDGRDPEASDPLIVVFGSEVRAEARFAPPGNFSDDGGLVEGGVTLTCG